MKQTHSSFSPSDGHGERPTDGLPPRQAEGDRRSPATGTRNGGRRTAPRRLTLSLCRGAMIAALYVVLTYLSSLFGLSSGVIQCRLSELLCILPALLPEAVPGLGLGCLLANLLTGGTIYDLTVGTACTVLGAVGARLLRRLPRPLCFLITLPTVVANALGVPAVILLSAAGAEQWSLFPYYALTVAAGELIAATVLGTLLYLTLTRPRNTRTATSRRR